MASKFIEERELQRGLANLSLRLANCTVYTQKIECSKDRATVSSHYDLIARNLGNVIEEAQVLLNALENKELRFEFLQTYAPAKGKENDNLSQEKEAQSPLKQVEIQNLKLKLKAYPCELKEVGTLNVYQGKIKIISIEATRSANKFKVIASLTCEVSQNKTLTCTNLPLTYNIKNPDHIIFQFEDLKGRKFNGKFAV